MLGKLSVALLLAASPAVATEPAGAPAQEYVIKKVCQTYEVAGSSIPRQSCTKKKVPIKKPPAESQESTSSGSSGGSENEPAKAPEGQ